MTNTKIIAIAAVVIVVAAAAVAAVTLTNDEDGSFSIVDGKGTTFTFEEPIDGAVLCNTNIPKAMKILGFEDKVKGLSFYSASTDASNWDLFSPLFPDTKHMTITKNLTDEEIIKETGVKYVIAPVKSMTISEKQELAFNQQGIKVIRLDCNGDTAFDDFEKLIKIFTGESTNAAYNEYKGIYDGVVNTVVSKVNASAVADKTFLAYMNSQDAFYNQTSVISDNIEMVYGKNALRNIAGIDLTGVSNDATQDGLREAVIALDDSDNIDKLILRMTASATKTVTKAEEGWAGTEICQRYGHLSAIAAGEVYLFNTDIMSGPLSYIGFVYYAEISGVDTGYDVAELIDQYNDKYGFTERSTGLVYKIVDGAATEIVVT